MQNKIIEIFKKYGITLTYKKESDSPTATTYYFMAGSSEKLQAITIKKATEELNYRTGTFCEWKKTPDADVSIRVIKKQRETVLLADYLHIMTEDTDSPKFFAGIDDNGGAVMLDFDEIVHLLIAGTTGSGKSVLLKSIICGMALKPQRYNMVMIDLKGTELPQFQNLSHLPVATDADAAKEMVARVRMHMDSRYQAMRENKLDASKLPKLVLIIDEYAELKLLDKSIETDLIHIAQKGRACGVHLIIATQRPEQKILNGLLKENIPCKIALQTSNPTSSRIILDTTGAEKLQGKGDALIKLPSQVAPVHFQAPFIDGEMLDTLISQCEVLMEYSVNVLATKKQKGGFFRTIGNAIKNLYQKTTPKQRVISCLVILFAISFLFAIIGAN